VAFDDQIRKALDRALNGVHAHLESDLRAFAKDIIRAAAEERAAAVAQAAEAAAADVRRQAQAQLSQLRDTAQKHTDDLRRSAEAQINELKRLLENCSASTDCRPKSSQVRTLSSTPCGVRPP